MEVIKLLENVKLVTERLVDRIRNNVDDSITDSKLLEFVERTSYEYLYGIQIHCGVLLDQSKDLDNLLSQITAHLTPPPILDQLPLPSSSGERAVDWLALPDHILQLVADRFIDVKDVIGFAAVCKQWRSFVHTAIGVQLHRQVPLLMLSSQVDHDGPSRSLYSVTEKKMYNSEILIPDNRFIISSSYGWLVTVSKNNDVSLLNPFLLQNNEIHLPSLTSLDARLGQPYYVKKAILSANPISNSDFIVIAIYGGFRRIAFCKPGDRCWTKLDLAYALMDDVICFRDQFYFVHWVGDVFSCELSHDSSDPKMSKVASSPFFCDGTQSKYLVESFGDLLLILRDRDYPDDDDSCDYFTRGFLVFKLDLIALKWVELKSICGRTIFLGDNSSFSVSAFDFPGCRPDCIYVTDDYHEGYMHVERHGVGPHDIGVFNLEDGSYEPCYTRKSNLLLLPRPIWIEPTPRLC